MPRTNRVYSVLSVLLVMALVLPLVGCGAKSEPTVPPTYQAQPTTPPEPTAVPEPTEAPVDNTVKVAYVATMSFAALFAADGQGYFVEQGLDVQFERVRSGTEAIAFLAEGQVDVGAIAIVASAWNAFSQDLDLRVVAPGALRPLKNDPTLLIVRKDLWDSGEVQTVADLKGRRVAAAGGPGSGGEYFVAKALETGGLKIADVQMENLANPDMPPAFESGAIDAALVGAPHGTTILQSGTGVVLAQDMSPGAMVVVYVYSGKFMRERPEVAKKVMMGLMQGARAVQGDEYLSDKNVEAFVRLVGSTEEAIRNTDPLLYDPNMGMPVEGLLDLQRIYMDNGRLEYTTPLGLADIADLSWQQDALEELGRWGPPALSPVETVKVAYVPIMHFAAVYVAEGRGYFDALGLNVEFMTVKSGTEAIAFLAEGSVDVGAIAVVASTWNAFSQGFDLRVVAPSAFRLLKDDPTMLLVRKDLWDSGEVKTAADLKGRTVAAAGGPGSGGEYGISRALEPVGLTIFDVDLQNIGNADMPAAMEAGAVDAAYTGSPYATAMIDAGTAVPLVKDFMPGDMGPVFVFSGQFMQERPEAAKRFMIGLLQGARAMQGDGYLSAENMASYLQFVNSTEENIRNTPAMLYDPNMSVYLESLETVQRVFMQNGRLEYTTPLSMDSIVDLSWQQYALMILGAYEQ